MIIKVLTKDRQTLATASITGLLLEVTYAGSFNVNPIIIVCRASGRPDIMEFTDDGGIAVLNRIRWNGVYYLRVGDTVSVAPGKLSFRGKPIEDPNWVDEFDACETFE